MTALALKDVSKSFGAVSIVKNVSLDVKPGEFIVFVGPSGCGKSTLLRMIAGLESITSGDLLIDDARSNDVEPSRRGIAMVFQSYALYPHMTVEENMGFALRYAGVPKAEIKSRVTKAAETLNLTPLLARRPKALSGGQRQRVAIGRAIVRDPKIFLFDEPLSNLDAELRVHMRIEIAKLHRQLGVTTIYVTHDQVEAMTLADRIVVLNDGRIEQVGKPLELYEDPANLFVAGFVGSPKINILPAVVEEAKPGSSILTLQSLDGVKLKIPVGGLKKNQMVKLGIRPEHFTAKSTAELAATVEIIEQLGAESLVYARAGSAGTQMLTIRRANASGLTQGGRFKIGLPAENLLLFGEDGKRLRH
jgi:lactose/L-arabinose transport system ATP-binding protein